MYILMFKTEVVETGFLLFLTNPNSPTIHIFKDKQEITQMFTTFYLNISRDMRLVTVQHFFQTFHPFIVEATDEIKDLLLPYTSNQIGIFGNMVLGLTGVPIDSDIYELVGWEDFKEEMSRKVFKEDLLTQMN
jgi:hypothetical protein